jgi:hypothetical protein
MYALAPAMLLSVWERGARLHPLDRALLLVRCAHLEASETELLDWPVGRRDRVLLQMQLQTFGPTLHADAECPACTAKLELSVDGRALLLDHGDPSTTLCVAGHSYRIPRVRDLHALARCRDPEHAVRTLVERCSLHVGTDEAPAPAVISESMALADPAAQLDLGVACDACGHDFSAPFDVACFLWEHVEARSRRLIAEVHQLARAYAWSESEILALSEARRAAYLAMVS